jgi:hypothetical protein
MPKVSKQTVQPQDIGVGEVYEGHVDGHEVTFMSFRVPTDLAPMLEGLPGDQCTCPHWGYVVAGQVTFTFPDHKEVFVAGDAFHVDGGHTPAFTAGTEWLIISPDDQMAPVNEVLQRNVAAAMQSASSP